MALTTVKTSALTGDINLTSQVTGTLPTGNGGTGATSFAPGKIGQVISQTLAPCQTSTTGTSYVATSFSIDITPTATSSKIYVTFNCGGVYHSTSNGGLIIVTLQFLVLAVILVIKVVVICKLEVVVLFCTLQTQLHKKITKLKLQIGKQMENFILDTQTPVILTEL